MVEDRETVEEEVVEAELEAGAGEETAEEHVEKGVEDVVVEDGDEQVAAEECIVVEHVVELEQVE